MTAVDLMSRVGQIQATLAQLASVRAGGAVAVSQSSKATTTATEASAGTSSTAFADALAAVQGTADSLGTGAGSSDISGAISSALEAGSAALPSAAGGSTASSATIGSPAAVTADNPKGATGTDVTADAKKYLGVPYVWGGTDPAVGFDCSGFVQHVFKDLGVSVPRLVRDQMNAGTTVPTLAQAKPGDLLVMNGVEHIGIYLGNNQYIHAPIPGQKVSIASIPAGFQFDRIVRVVPSAAPGAAAGTPAAAAAGSDPAGLVALASAARAALLAGSSK